MKENLEVAYIKDNLSAYAFRVCGK